MPSLTGVYRKFEEQYFNLAGLMQMYGEDGYENKEIQCFRKGTRVTGDNIWEMLSNLANSDREGLGKLLGVSPDVVGSWPKLIASNQERLKKADDLLNANKRPVMISTGK
jgi:hypothetical protein